MRNLILLLFWLAFTNAQCQNINLSNVFYSNQNYLYTPEYQKLLNYSVNSALANTPSGYQKSRQDAFLRALQVAGILAITDVLHLKATNGSPIFSDLNWVNEGSNSTIRKLAPTYIKNGGFKYNGSTNYSDENWSPSQGVNYTQNSCEFIVGLTGVTQSGSFIHGGRNSTAGNYGAVLAPFTAASQAIVQVNAGVNTLTDAQFNGSDGLYFVGRTSSSSVFGKVNSGTRVTGTSASQTPTTTTFKTGAMDTGGAISLYSPQTCTIFWAGGLLTTTQEAQFLTAYNAYITSIQTEVTPVFGTIYNVSSWSSLSDFTVNGATASVVSNAIQLTGGTGVNTKSLDLNSIITCQEFWTMKAHYNMASITGSSRGLGIGVRSSSTNTKYDIIAWPSMTTGAVVARLYVVVNGIPNSAVITQTTGLTATASDTYELILQRAENTFTVSIQDITTSSTVYSYSFSLALTSANILPNTGKFSLFSLGGTINVTSLTVTSQTPLNATYALVGDSKAVGYFAGTWGQQFSKLIGDHLIPGVVLGGGADESGDMASRTAEIIALNPQVVLIAGASNDPRFGVSSGTTNTNLDNINTTLTAAGLKVVWITGIYETSGNNQTNIQSHINATYPNVIDILGNVITLNADGIHPDPGGHSSTALNIINSGKLTFK